MEDGSNFDKSEIRRYHESLKCAQRAGKHFQNENVDLVLQLGMNSYPSGHGS